MLVIHLIGALLEDLEKTNTHIQDLSSTLGGELGITSKKWIEKIYETRFSVFG